MFGGTMAITLEHLTGPSKMALHIVPHKRAVSHDLAPQDRQGTTRTPAVAMTRISRTAR